MKQNVKVSGEVELSQDEVKDALLNYAKRDRKFLHNALVPYMEGFYGYSIKKLATSTINNELIVKLEVSSSKSDLKSTLFHTEKEPGVRNMPSGFIRKNVGFYKELREYLLEERKKGHKEVTFDKAHKDMMFTFPSLDEKKFLIYCLDKRQQKSKGFQFDSKKRILTVRG